MTTAAIITTAGRAAMLGGLVLTAGSAGACEMANPGRSYPAQEKLNAAIHDVLENKRVRQQADCSWVNGGKDDYGKASAAIDLGGGRVGQWIDDQSAMLVSVCAERQVVILMGLELGEVESTCGPAMDLDITSLDPASGKFAYRAGKDFAGFMVHVKKVGMSQTEDLDAWIDQDSPKDHVNLLCGCEIFYPQTMN